MNIITQTLSGIFSKGKVTDNVGATPPKPRGVGEKGGRRGHVERHGPSVGATAETVLGSAGARTKKDTTDIVGAVPLFVTKRYGGEIAKAISQASRSAEHNNRPLGVVLSEQAKNILGRLEKRAASTTTEQKYLRAYELMMTSERTPLEMATTRQAFNFYRSAWRFGLMQQIQTLGKASEKARKAGNLDSAKRRTTRQFHLAIALEQSMLDTWAPKAKAIRSGGGKVKSKSKNPAKGGPVAPHRGVAVAPLFANGGRQERVINRHVERLAILDAAGLRPAELLKGVRIQAIKNKRGKPVLLMTVEGAKWDGHQKGQQARSVAFFPKTASEKALWELSNGKGGDFVFKSTPADIRSLNRALNKAVDGLSCYSYRHAFGGSLKRACLAGEMTREEAAKAMGHRSTESLSYYGQPSRSGGRKLKAQATDEIRNPSKPMNKAAMKKGGQAAPKDDGFRFPSRPTQQVSTRSTMSRPVGPLAKGPKPPKW
jgi:integrase